MRKKIIFFDGDGTLWYPRTTARRLKPWWVYRDEATKGDYLNHLVLAPAAPETLVTLRERGMLTVLLSTHPHEADEAAAILAGKVRHFGLEALFDEIHATADYPAAKGEKMLEILTRRGFSPADALMVGDSYRWDYAPAEAAGIEAALLDSDYHRAKAADEPAKIIIQEIDGLLSCFHEPVRP